MTGQDNGPVIVSYYSGKVRGVPVKSIKIDAAHCRIVLRGDDGGEIIIYEGEHFNEEEYRRKVPVLNRVNGERVALRK